MRRSLILSLVAVVLAGVATVTFVRLVGGSPARGHRGPSGPSVSDLPSRTPTPTASASTSPTVLPSPPPAAPAALTYLRGTRIVTRVLGKAPEHTMVDLHTPDVSASSTSSWIAYIVARKGSDPSGNGDFVRRPELHLMDLASGADLDVGVGFDPLWKTDGTEVAYLAPNQPRSCDGETCAGSVRVMVVAPNTSSRAVTGYGRLHLLAWAGEQLLVSDESDLKHTALVASDGSGAMTIPVAPSEIWDASPDGGMLITVRPGRVIFTKLREGRPTQTVATFHLAAILGDGSWSPSPDRVAGVERKSDGTSLLALLSPDRGLVPVPGSKGAMGNVVWDSTASRLAFVAVDLRNRSRLQTVLCRLTVGARPSCRRWFSWSQGVSLLKLSSS